MRELICICDRTVSGNKYSYITLGKHYIRKNSSTRFYLINDAGLMVGYPLRNFMELNEWRNLQLDKLVDR